MLKFLDDRRDYASCRVGTKQLNRKVSDFIELRCIAKAEFTFYFRYLHVLNVFIHNKSL